ncbi:MAG: aromatic ring-hydroxylating dioxygenase subunit alpha [Alcaligenaceae bacterium]|nr:MAG: aromatic ring-hydroxylating dioxygenase subunit alpha [Alcaligenaceae bacterium]
MIEPVLPAACYTQDTWFALEKEHIFEKLWIFAGLTQQLQSENSFIARDFSGVPILIQKTGGLIRAFKNACAHRGMPVQIADCGSRKLICPYHGWTYADDGALRGIPNPELYDICQEKRNNIRLHSYAVEVIGNFVFVNLSQTPQPIQNQFSEHLINILREVSPYFAPELSYTHFTNNYNWKLNFENVLDWNHAQFVHRQSLAPLLQFDSSGTFSGASSEKSRLFFTGSPLAEVRFSGDAPISGKIDLKDVSRVGRSAMPHRERWFSKLFEAPCDIGAFFACNIFPNVNFGSIHGENFYLQQYVPLAPDRIEYHSWIFTTRLKSDVPAQPHLLWGIHHAEKRVIDEDSILLTALQKSLASLESTGPMGDHEASLAAMGKWYLQNLKTA